MTHLSVTPIAVVILFCAILLAGPGVESGSAGGQLEPAPEPAMGPSPAEDASPACNPAELELAAGTHSNGLVSFSVIASGAMGDRREAGVELVSDEAGWTGLRERGLVEEDLEAPDFSESAALVVYAGRRPTAGYRVRVTRVRLLPETAGSNGRELVVEAVAEGPPEGSMAATVVTAPYVVITLSTDSALSEKLTINLKIL
ncbi:MAG: protease complex subunit PrcB family protein [Spirochaetota bacterium]